LANIGEKTMFYAEIYRAAPSNYLSQIAKNGFFSMAFHFS